MPSTSCHLIGAHKILNDNENRILIIDQQLLRFPPLHYQLLIHLLSGNAVAETVLGEALYGCGLEPEVSNNLGKIARKIRSRLHPLGLTVERVAKQGYILLAIPD